MAGIPLPAVTPENWNEGNISKPWSQFIDYTIPTRMPIDGDPVLKSTPRWTAVLQPEPTLVPRFARLELSLPDRLLGALPGFLASPGAFSFTGAPLWTSDIPDNLATCLDYLPKEIGMAGRGYSGMTVTTDVRVTIGGVAFVAVRGLTHAFNLVLDKVTFTNPRQPNSWRNDWSTMCGDYAVLVGQDYSHEVIRDMPGLQSGLVLQSSSTHEGLPAVLVQIGYRMLAAKVRFAMLFSTTVFRLVEIDPRFEQGHTLLVSPAYWVSSEHPGDSGMPNDLEAKPLPALLTAMILADLRDPLLLPAACELESLGPVLPSGTTTTERRRFSGTEAVVPDSGVSQEQVLAFSYDATGVSPAARLLRRARLQRQEAVSRLSTLPLPTSSPIIPPVPEDCPALGTLPDPPEIPEPQHRLVLREHVAYEGCLEAWRGTLDQSSQVLAKLFLHEHIESAHREACAYERFLSVPRIEGTTVPRYWGTYTYRGEFYVIVLEDTGPKLKSFRDCNPRQMRAIARHARKVHGSGLGFPAAVSHFTRDTDGDIRVVDFGDSFEHRCDPQACEELKKLVRLLDEVV
ncbi:hypothetical protein EDB87DRAFT_1686276 [Lactarius vividus]|nr:hypothetical protein EDB87DRAFT_1686276 [Lactarius vividus]